jgi:BON domain
MASGKQIVDQGMGLLRGTSRQLFRVGRRVASDGYGMVQRARQARAAPKPGMDDVTLTRKVESVVFRDADAPKGSVDVNAVDGVVQLRGEVKNPEQLKKIEEAVRSVPEVRDVENLLHLPKTPAPTRTDTPAGHRTQRRTRPSPKRATPRREAKVTSEESTPPQAEPSPAESAAKGEGRSPAPLGGDEGEDS